MPELISLFKESADIQTPDMLKLPVPEVEYENVVLKPSDYQKDMVTSLADRAEAVRNRMVQPNEDNMLKITNDGRKLALDQDLSMICYQIMIAPKHQHVSIKHMKFGIKQKSRSQRS